MEQPPPSKKKVILDTKTLKVLERQYNVKEMQMSGYREIVSALMVDRYLVGTPHPHVSCAASALAKDGDNAVSAHSPSLLLDFRLDYFVIAWSCGYLEEIDACHVEFP